MRACNPCDWGCGRQPAFSLAGPASRGDVKSDHLSDLAISFGTAVASILGISTVVNVLHLI